MSQRAGKLLPQQHPFQVGQEVQSVEVIIAVADDVTNENRWKLENFTRFC